MYDIPGAVKAGADLITTAISRIWPDPTETQRTELEALKVEVGAALQHIQGQFAVIIAEAQGDGFLQRNWRPLTMLTFLFLVVSYFFGFHGTNFGPDDAKHLWSLIELGLGGYVIGRTVEKVAVPVIGAIKDMRR